MFPIFRLDISGIGRARNVLFFLFESSISTLYGGELITGGRERKGQNARLTPYA